ncbi:MAG: guanylate kinase [Oscillospiraceae bacterium]|nr:guanylate kinase [Oscillospiraceae bacterium]MBQ6215565.1 guanylate kinase [Oscillospiraceae bacterium]
MVEKGRLYVVSGPSGVGKNTVIDKAIAGRDDICFSTSVTTRKPREGEIDGEDYFFVDRETFDKMVRDGELLEHATYVSNGYGTPKAFVEEKISQGMSVISDIDVQGGRQIKAATDYSVLIFIVTPTMDELRKRLEARGTETEESIRSRLERAKAEYAESIDYDYIIVNDDLDTAAEEMKAIFTAEKCRYKNREFYLKEV